VFAGRGLTALAFVCWSTTVFAQQWSEQLFAEKTYNFGAVARATKVEHTFVLKNSSNQTVHISGVRSSCGCTQPRVVNDTAGPGEQAAVVAAFNTRSFTGQHGAWVTVTIDRPQYAEVRLRVDGYIRTDVVVDPGEISFGSISHGAAATKKATINYAGRSDWKISEVKTNSPYVTAKIVETARTPGRVSYELEVDLAENAPVGYVSDELQLVTNDARARQVPVRVEGLVVANLTVSPSPLMLGTLRPGQHVTRQLIVKGTKPFRITEITAEDAGFSFEPSDEEKSVHVVKVAFDAGASAQTLTGKIIVRTDLPEAGTVEVAVKGQVAAPLAGTN
jgi:hypothetical protein